MDPALLRWAERLVRLLNMNAPDPIVAQAVSCLYNRALAVMGKCLLHYDNARAIADARQRHGFCNECDGNILPQNTHPAICAKCKVKEQVEWLKYHMDHPDQCCVCEKVDDVTTYECHKCKRGFCFEHWTGGDGITCKDCSK